MLQIDQLIERIQIQKYSQLDFKNMNSRLIEEKLVLKLLLVTLIFRMGYSMSSQMYKLLETGFNTTYLKVPMILLMSERAKLLTLGILRTA